MKNVFRTVGAVALIIVASPILIPLTLIGTTGIVSETRGLLESANEA